MSILLPAYLIEYYEIVILKFWNDVGEDKMCEQNVLGILVFSKSLINNITKLEIFVSSKLENDLEDEKQTEPA